MLDNPFSPLVNSSEETNPQTPQTPRLKDSPWLTRAVTNTRRHSMSHLVHKVDQSIFCSKVNQTVFALDFTQIERKKTLNVICNINSPTIRAKAFDALFLEKNSDNKKYVLEWLKDKGYEHVVENLQFYTGYPWDKIIQIKSPVMIEQLIEIYLLSQQKSSALDLKNIHQLMDFSLHLAHLATQPTVSPRLEGFLHEGIQILGQIIYLINQNIEKTLLLIDRSNEYQTLKTIRNEFKQYMHEMNSRLQDHYTAHKKTNLQDPDRALYNRIPLEIAKTLLTDRGTINVGIIDNLLKIFLSQRDTLINYEVNLFHTLTLLQRSPLLRAEFVKIGKPLACKTHAIEIIRTSLSLLPTEPITNLHTRTVALQAILSHVRQSEESKSCFAAALVSEILSSHVGYCLKDLQKILQRGKLTRKIKEIRQDIPLVTRIRDINLNKKIQFNAHGRLFVDVEKEKEPFFLWEAPGLQAACLAIGCKEPFPLFIKFLHSLPKQKIHKMKINSLLYALCQEFNKKCINELHEKACFAFSAQTSCCLLKIWENAIASMAEAEKSSLLKTAILQSILYALQFILEKNQIKPSLLIQRFFLQIQKVVYEKIQLRFIPTLVMNLKSSFSSVDGGFMLYNQEQPIQDEKSFRNFILDLFLEINHVRRHMNSHEGQELSDILHILTKEIDTDEFMQKLLIHYHSPNQKEIADLWHIRPFPYDKLPITPWITHAGHDSKALLKIYFESEDPFTNDNFLLNGAYEALTTIIEMCKKMSEKEKQLFINNPNKLKPFLILDKHRLPFMAGHPSLIQSWQQNCLTKDWIEQYIVSPGNEISQNKIDEEMHKIFIEKLRNILPSYHLPSAIHKCLKEIQKLSYDLTIKEYRQSVLQICYTDKMSKEYKVKLALQIDTQLIQSLNSISRKILEKSAVHFADTNWCQGIQDVHFCFVVNPGTGELELWEAEADGSHLVALDQHYWLQNKRWEFLTIPENIAPDDTSFMTDEVFNHTVE
jgi:hypothetical protein